jgi:hypothetical protein
MIELSCDLITKEPASTARRNCPSFNVLGIAPNKVTECTLVRNLLSTSDDANLVDCTDLRAQTTVDTKNLPIDDGSEDKEVENLTAGLPNGSVAILLLTLFVEAVNLGDLAGLVVPSDESNLVWIP